MTNGRHNEKEKSFTNLFKERQVALNRNKLTAGSTCSIRSKRSAE